MPVNGEKPLYSFPKPTVTSSNNPASKETQCTFTSDKGKQQILTLESLKL